MVNVEVTMVNNLTHGGNGNVGYNNRLVIAQFT
jgi:hypothetical protein